MVEYSIFAETHIFYIFGETKHKEKHINGGCYFVWLIPMSSQLEKWLCLLCSSVVDSEVIVSFEKMFAHAKPHDSCTYPSNFERIHAYKYLPEFLYIDKIK